MANTIPDDDPRRKLTIARADAADAVHVGLAGNTYTILLTGRDTAGRYCLIDMHVAPGGVPGLTGTISKNRLRSSKARSKRCSGESASLSAPVRP